jgi:serine/threonine protein kinase
MNPGDSADLPVSSASAGPAVGSSLARAMAKEALQSGEDLDAVALLARHPEWAANKSMVLDLAYEEYCQRVEAGRAIDPEEFCGRFPDVQSSLRRLLGIHHFLEENPHLLTAYRQAPWPVAEQEFLGYRLVRELGRGSFARVFLATEPALGQRQVVVKISRLGGAEAKTLGRLHHPNIVPIHTAHVDPNTGFSIICMPYLGNATLCNLLDRVCASASPPESGRVLLEMLEIAAKSDNALQPTGRKQNRRSYVDTVLGIGIQLAEALAFAHAQGICHRDLKPSNVLMTADGRPMLLDFNLSSDEHIGENHVGGTLPYMSPEQVRATDPNSKAESALVDSRSDVFSLGVILYELLTGVFPFGQLPAKGPIHEMRSRLLASQRHGPRSLRELNPQVDRPLAWLVERCLAWEPQDRLQSARELAVALRHALSWRRRTTRWLSNHRYLAALGALMLVIVVSLAAYAWLSQDPASVRQHRQGIALYQRGDYREAVEHFNRSLADEPQSAETLYARGRALQQLGDWNMARADFQLASGLTNDARAWACQGYCRCRLEENKQAIALFERAVSLNLASAEVFNDLVPLQG